MLTFFVDHKKLIVFYISPNVAYMDTKLETRVQCTGKNKGTFLILVLVLFPKV